MKKKLEIVKNDEKKLRQKSQPVLNLQDKEIQDLIDQMFVIMRVGKGGVGLAAPQVGKLLRLFIIDLDGKGYVFVNPKIEKISKKEAIEEEGCLSFPGVFLNVKRPAKVVASAWDRYGKKIKIKADGIFARAIQHEYDHLDGVLFIDKENLRDNSEVTR
ncbi:peptide deformylase [bacterium]|nr:MAG: peptide deformylase [bacterium]